MIQLWGFHHRPGIVDMPEPPQAKGLSKDIATEFRGRATQVHAFLLSFDEYYSHVGSDERKVLDSGGMALFSCCQ